MYFQCICIFDVRDYFKVYTHTTLDIKQSFDFPINLNSYKILIELSTQLVVALKIRPPENPKAIELGMSS